MSENRHFLRKQEKRRAPSDKRSAHGGRSEISEQGAKRRSDKLSNGWPKRPLAKFPYHCHMH